MQKVKRLKRAKKCRARIKKLGIERLTVFRTPKHVYAQIITSDGSRVLGSASTLQDKVESKSKYPGNVKSAAAVGTRIAEKANEFGITKVAFDRGGFKYHGRIKALADAAREAGLNF